MWPSTRLILILKFDNIKWGYSPMAVKDQRDIRLTYRVLIFCFLSGKQMSLCIASGIKNNSLWKKTGSTQGHKVDNCSRGSPFAVWCSLHSSSLQGSHIAVPAHRCPGECGLSEAGSCKFYRTNGKSGVLWKISRCLRDCMEHYATWNEPDTKVYDSIK